MKEKPDWKEVQKKIKSGEIKVEMAPENKVTDLAYDFVEKCLDFKECLISDLSYVSDFLDYDNPDKEYQEVINKCQEIYGIDISKIVRTYYIVDIARVIEAGGEN